MDRSPPNGWLHCLETSLERLTHLPGLPDGFAIVVDRNSKWTNNDAVKQFTPRWYNASMVEPSNNAAMVPMPPNAHHP